MSGPEDSVPLTSNGPTQALGLHCGDGPRFFWDVVCPNCHTPLFAAWPKGSWEVCAKEEADIAIKCHNRGSNKRPERRCRQMVYLKRRNA